jgi:hypothetical protein
VNGLLQIDSAATLDITTFQMIGTLTSTNIHAFGILKTASQTAPPIPVGKSWEVRFSILRDLVHN